MRAIAGDRTPARLGLALALALLGLALQPTPLQAAPNAWPPWVRTVAYTSTGDHTKQLTQFYVPRDAEGPVPLLVGLHSWGGDYTQKLGVAYARWAVSQGWAFLHPNFRGPNRGPDTTGSDLVVEDVISAVEYAFEHANIDRDRVYLIGYSGGGHVGLLLAGRAPSYWAAVSAWGPISDLALWHEQVTRVAPRYLRSIESCCGGPPGASAAIDNQYRRRSPLGVLPLARGQVAFDLNAGLYDGHRGAPVPVRQALLAFNALAAPEDAFTDADIAHLTRHAEIPDHLRHELVADPVYEHRSPVYRRTSGPVRVTLFKGGHNMLPEPGLTWLAQQRRSTTLEARARRAMLRVVRAFEQL